MSGLLEITALVLTTPRADAAPAELAAWYGRKADLHEQLAAAAAGAERDHETTYARAARRHALQLTTTTTSEGITR